MATNHDYVSFTPKSGKSLASFTFHSYLVLVSCCDIGISRLFYLFYPTAPVNFAETHVLMLAEQFLCGYNEPKPPQTPFLGQSLRGRMQNINFRSSAISRFQSDSAVSTFTLFFLSTPSPLLSRSIIFSLAVHLPGFISMGKGGK